MAWTSQQQTAIDARNSGLIVSAAAGSGKTSVLVERIKRIIADKRNQVPIERLVDVKFTVDAAAEIRHRLSLSLENAIAEAPDDQWLRRQQMLLHSARISTINSFCFELIREHMDGSTVTSGFRVLDDGEQKLMLIKAVDTVMSRWHIEREDDMQILWNAFCHKSDAPIEMILTELYRFFEAIPFRDEWIENTLARYSVPMYDNYYFRHMLDSFRHEADVICRLCDKAVYLAGDIYTENNNVLEWVSADYDVAALLRKHLSEEKPDPGILSEIAVNGMNIHKGNYPPKPRKNVENKPHFNQVRDIRNSYKERLKDLMSDICMNIPYFENDMKEHLRILPLIFEMEKELEECLWEMKTEKNAISFSDGETLALGLLAERDEKGRVRPTALAKEMSEFYELIMIDEYQDSNNKQDYIFKLLSRNCCEEGTGNLRYGNNVFLVGDVKQSIYRFRNANPLNFSRAVNDSEVYSEESVSPLQLIRLSRNFRSSRSVVDFVNFLFGNIMSERCGEVSYGEEEKLYTGAVGYDILSHEEQAVEVAILPEKDDSEEELLPAAMYTAETIRKMLDEGFPVLMRDGSRRPCSPEDFCILMRGKKHSKAFVKALEEQDVPVKGIDETGYLKSREISLLLSLLRVLDNPLLEIPLAAVMVSPMFSFTADDLAEIRLTDKSMSLYPAMCLMLERKSASETLLKKCQSLYDTIAQLRFDSALYSLEALIRRIYDTTDFMSVMQLYKDGAKKRANLRLLMQYAKDYEKNAADSSRGSVSGFLRYVDTMMEKDSDFTQADSSGGSDKAVVIKTMHGSKGLEYPFVFVCMTETEFNKRDNVKKLYCTDKFTAGLRLQNPDTLEKYASMPHVVIQDEMENNMKSEELRLLYVALTRAKQKLFIPLRYHSGDKKMLERLTELLGKSGTITPGIALGVNSMAEWIWMSLLIRRDEKLCALVPECAAYTGEAAETTSEINYTAIYEYAGKIARESKPMPAPTAGMITGIRKMLAHEYNPAEREQVSLLSVSAASKLSGGESLTLKRPGFITKTGGSLTGAEHGTAVHAFFQYANFRNAETDSIKEIQRLYDAGFITRDQMATIRPQREIDPFFRHELYGRIRNAKQILRERKFLVRMSDLGLPMNPPSEKYTDLCSMRNSGSMMKGIIDLAFEEEDGFVLVDYKTDYAHSPSELMEKYELQLYIYSLALKNITGKPVKECVIYSTHLNETVPVVFDNKN